MVLDEKTAHLQLQVTEREMVPAQTDITLREDQAQMEDFGSLVFLEEHFQMKGVVGPGINIEPATVLPIEPMEQTCSLTEETVPISVLATSTLHEEPPQRASRSHEVPRFRRRMSSSSSESEPDQGPVKITTRAQVHVDAGKEPLAKKESPGRVKTTRVQPTEVERALLKEMDLITIDKRDKKLRKGRETKKKADGNLNIYLMNVIPSKIVRINKPNEVKYAGNGPCPAPQFALLLPDATNSFKVYLIKDNKDVQKRGAEAPPAVSLVTPVEEQTPVEGPQIVVQPPVPEVPIETPLTEVPAVPSLTSTAMKRAISDFDEGRSIEELIHSLQEKIPSPRKKPRLPSARPEPEPRRELHFLTIPGSRDLTAEQAELVSVAPAQSRQQDIVDKVFTRKSVTLEEVCQRPINKLNISRAFADVLVLCKDEYVSCLVNPEDPLEMQFVGRGSRMTD